MHKVSVVRNDLLAPKTDPHLGQAIFGRTTHAQMHLHHPLPFVLTDMYISYPRGNYVHRGRLGDSWLVVLLSLHLPQEEEHTDNSVRLDA